MLSKSAVGGSRTDSPESSDRVSSCSGPRSRRSPTRWCFRRIWAREGSMHWLASLRAGRRGPSLDLSNTVPEFLQPPAIRRLASCESASCVHASGAPTSYLPAYRSRPFWPIDHSTLFLVKQVLRGIVRRHDDRFQWRRRSDEKTAFYGRSTQRRQRPTGWTIRTISFLLLPTSRFRRLVAGPQRGPRE